MKNIQRVIQSQRLRQMPLRDLVNFQKLFRANVQNLPEVTMQILNRNILFDGVDGKGNVESIDDYTQQDYDQYLSDLYNRAEEAAGYQMNGDGPAFEIPDDRKKFLSLDETLIEDLEKQLSRFKLSDVQKEIGTYFIQSLRHPGYLNAFSDPTNYLIRTKQYKPADVEFTLNHLRSHISPAGLFAVDAKHAIQLQAKRLPDGMVKESLLKLIDLRYSDLMNKKVKVLAQVLAINDKDHLSDVFRTLESFTPTPLPSQEKAHSVRSKKEPDFTVRFENGEFVARFTGKNFIRIKKNSDYSATLTDLESAAEKNSKAKQDAHYQFLKSENKEVNKIEWMLKVRQKALEQIVGHILNVQKEYLLTGDADKIVPLLVKDIAEQFKVDPSTVSRIASEKYIQLEGGDVIDLRELLSQGVRTRADQRIAFGEIKKTIKNMVDSEDHANPLTFDEIEEALKEQGHMISSRTIKKLCEGMEIPDSRIRKANYHEGKTENKSVDEVMKKMNLTRVVRPDENQVRLGQLKITM